MAATPSANKRLSLATGVGLFIALVVPFLSYAVGRLIFGVVAHATIDGIALLVVTIAGA